MTNEIMTDEVVLQDRYHLNNNPKLKPSNKTEPKIYNLNNQGIGSGEGGKTGNI